MSEHANISDAAERARPHWWPEESQWQRLAAGLREAAEGTVLPAHEELVLPARSALEREAAGTLVYLIWLELLQQTRLSQAMLEPASADAPDDDQAFKNHMRLLSAKNQAYKLLEQARRAAEESPPGAESHHPPAQQQPRVAGAETQRPAPRGSSQDQPPRCAEATTPHSALQSGPRPRGGGRRVAALELPLSGGVSAAAWEEAYGNLSESQREALHKMFGRVPGSERTISDLSTCGGPSPLPPPQPSAPAAVPRSS